MASTLVIAHRGASLRAEENTLEAFEIAGELGVDGVETDVRRSADGVLVLHHDPAREGLGVLGERSFDEIRAAAPQVPTLGEALAVLPRGLVNLELKCLPWEPDFDHDRSVAAGLVQAVLAGGLVERVVISSFDLDAVNVIRSLSPSIKTAWLTAGRAVSETVHIAGDLGHAFVHPDIGAVMQVGAGAAVEVAHAAGIGVNVWTVNEPSEMQALLDAGADGIVTDLPEVALSLRTG